MDNEMCEGHLIPRRKWYKLDFMQHYECEACLPDENNKLCPDYKPISVFKVKEGGLDGIKRD